MRIIAFRRPLGFERQWWKTIADTILSKLCKAQLPMQRVFRHQLEKSGTGLHCQGAQLSFVSDLNGECKILLPTPMQAFLPKTSVLDFHSIPSFQARQDEMR
jgi:hypothetical protein